ncbi:MarR family transcriptional regulator [Microbacterium sp.]|uniref:MarR family winged helix-turn-helix transcriptional regulator n=1 Tax=Microbacterium sp. TaxID=51671 RepID=UPI0025EC6214|nr:MarR family transcriptional regulator [Microbacterium sp.]
MHQRIRATTSLGENELRILQLLLTRRRDGFDVKPSEISRHLGISSASTTALIDRLERQGSVERRTHPTDRRSILIAPTDRAVDEVADVVDAFADRVGRAIDALSVAERAVVIGFLDAVTEAADDIAPARRRERSFA